MKLRDLGTALRKALGLKKVEAEPAVLFLGDLQRLRLEPGDLLVLSTDQRLSMETAERLRSTLATATGDRRVLVLDCGLKLGVLANAEPPAA
jgi:hypothetical protein